MVVLEDGTSSTSSRVFFHSHTDTQTRTSKTSWHSMWSKAFCYKEREGVFVFFLPWSYSNLLYLILQRDLLSVVGQKRIIVNENKVYIRQMLFSWKNIVWDLNLRTLDLQSKCSYTQLCPSPTSASAAPSNNTACSHAGPEACAVPVRHRASLCCWAIVCYYRTSVLVAAAKLSAYSYSIVSTSLIYPGPGVEHNLKPCLFPSCSEAAWPPIVSCVCISEEDCLASVP